MWLQGMTAHLTLNWLPITLCIDRPCLFPYFRPITSSEHCRQIPHQQVPNHQAVPRWPACEEGVQRSEVGGSPGAVCQGTGPGSRGGDFKPWGHSSV